MTTSSCPYERFALIIFYHFSLSSAHKKVILATIEKYFVGKEYLTLEKHDICQLESMIISSINQKIEDTLILKPSEPKTEVR